MLESTYTCSNPGKDKEYKRLTQSSEFRVCRNGCYDCDRKRSQAAKCLHQKGKSK